MDKLLFCYNVEYVLFKSILVLYYRFLWNVQNVCYSKILCQVVRSPTPLFFQHVKYATKTNNNVKTKGMDFASIHVRNERYIWWTFIHPPLSIIMGYKEKRNIKHSIVQLSRILFVFFVNLLMRNWIWSIIIICGFYKQNILTLSLRKHM